MAEKTWPKGVDVISIDNLDRLGVDRETGHLYWDGKQVLTREKVELATYERVLAVLVALATVGATVIMALDRWLPLNPINP